MSSPKLVMLYALFKASFVLANQGEIIDLVGNNQHYTILIVNKDCMISLSIHISHQLQFYFHVLVPNAPSLLCPIDYLVKFENYTVAPLDMFQLR